MNLKVSYVKNEGRTLALVCKNGNSRVYWNVPRIQPATIYLVRAKQEQDFWQQRVDLTGFLILKPGSDVLVPPPGIRIELDGEPYLKRDIMSGRVRVDRMGNSLAGLREAEILVLQRVAEERRAGLEAESRAHAAAAYERDQLLKDIEAKNAWDARQEQKIADLTKEVDGLRRLALEEQLVAQAWERDFRAVVAKRNEISKQLDEARAQLKSRALGLGYAVGSTRHVAVIKDRARGVVSCSIFTKVPDGPQYFALETGKSYTLTTAPAFKDFLWFAYEDGHRNTAIIIGHGKLVAVEFRLQ